jgi:hypothetical protein
MKKHFFILFVITLVAMLPSCADHANAIVECSTCHTYGFWAGIWHGIIAPFDFIGSLIWPDDVAMYAQDNNGAWYAFGFLLGIGALGSGGITIKATTKRG